MLSGTQNKLQLYAISSITRTTTTTTTDVERFDSACHHHDGPTTTSLYRHVLKGEWAMIISRLLLFLPGALMGMNGHLHVAHITRRRRRRRRRCRWTKCIHNGTIASCALCPSFAWHKHSTLYKLTDNSKWIWCSPSLTHLFYCPPSAPPRSRSNIQSGHGAAPGSWQLFAMCLHRGTFGGGAGPCYLQSAQLSAADSTGFVRHNRLLGEAEEEVGVVGYYYYYYYYYCKHCVDCCPSVCVVRDKFQRLINTPVVWCGVVVECANST